jgi:gas vesicle protein
MRDRTAVLLGLVAGAAIGSVAGWLWLTDDGRRIRARLEPQLHDLAGQALKLRDSALRVQQAARDSVKTAQEVASRAPRG